MGGSCKYIEQAVMYSLQGVALQLGLGQWLTVPHCEKPCCYELASDFDGFFGMT